MAVVAAFAVGYAARYQSFVRSLDAYDIARQDGFADQDFPLLDRHQVTQLGTAHRPGFRPTTSYTTFERPKPAGVTRIGVFGCSFVQGSEAGPGQDFPSALQRLFGASGRSDVEVLNFGVGSFGVQQSYLLWQYLAADFDLDVTIYNLYSFHRRRDDTFVMLGRIYAPVHARYVLDGGSLRLVEVAGSDRREAAERYFRLRPTWACLRYDAKAPPQVRALLPSGRDLPNPLYYRRDGDAEIAELYARIFADMAVRSRRFVVLANDETSEALVEEAATTPALETVRTATEGFTWRQAGLFRAPRNHLSALGYEVLAREVHAVLVGGDAVTLPEIDISGACPEPVSSEVSRDLAAYDQVTLTLNGLPAGTFVEAADHRTVSPYSFRSNRALSVLDLSRGLTPQFIAARVPLVEGAICLRFTVDGLPAEVEVGRVRFVGSEHVGVLDRPWADVPGDGWVLTGRCGGGGIDLELHTRGRVDDLRLDLGDRTLLHGSVGTTVGAGPAAIQWSSAAAKFAPGTGCGAAGFAVGETAGGTGASSLGRASIAASSSATRALSGRSGSTIDADVSSCAIANRAPRPQVTSVPPRRIQPFNASMPPSPSDRSTAPVDALGSTITSYSSRSVRSSPLKRSGVNGYPSRRSSVNHAAP